MVYGIVLGLSLIGGALLGMFWWGVLAGILLDLLLALWIQYGKEFREKIRSWRYTTSSQEREISAVWSTQDWPKWFKILAGVLVVVILGTILFRLFGGVEYAKKITQEERWELVDVIDCSMGEVSWNDNRGWCPSSKEFAPGTYRIIIREVKWEQSLWNSEGTEVIGYMPTPAQGIGLASWQNTPSERKFLADAPLAGNRRVGSLIAKVGEGKPFDVIRTEDFDIERSDVIAISVNLPPSKDFFAYNRGIIRVEIEREID